MSASARIVWTQQDFLHWADGQDGRYEFDGFQPVAMTGGTVRHNLIYVNILVALRARLSLGRCIPLGPDTGVATVGTAVRYPDALITCSPFKGMDKTIDGAVAVFEVISPGSDRIDRIVKVREYAAVPSILRYIIVESDSVGATLLRRADGSAPWTATTLTDVDMLPLPEAGIEVPLAEFYAGISFGPDAPAA